MYITDRSKAVLLIWFSVFSCSRISFCAVLPSVCVDNIQLGIGSCQSGTFWEKAAHSVYRVFSVYFDLLLF